MCSNPACQWWLPRLPQGGAGGMGCSSPREWQRFYMGYKERFVDDCVIELRNGVTVRLAQAPSAKSAAKRFGGALDKASDPALTGTT